MLLLAATATAQNPSPSGNLYGTVLDEQERVLPGVTITLVGPGAPHAATSDMRGGFRFLNLSPGAYSVTLERSGFETVRRDVTVTLGKDAVFSVTMPVGSAAEAVTVLGQAPVLDSRETKTGATFERKELESIPTTRDPWSFLRRVPGVLVGNMNVGGDESAVQSFFIGKGSHFNQNAYFLDGVAVTDMATGGTPLYFDFDSLQDIEVATGGSDPSIPTSGVSINLVTKRGTHQLKGSGRLIYSEAGWAYGLEAGGPLWKDRLWLWGAGARNDFLGSTLVNVLGQTVTAEPTLEHWNAKLNAAPAPGNSLTLSYLHFDKIFVDPNNRRGGTNASGAVVEPLGDFGPTGGTLANSKWQFNVSAVVQLPLGIEVGANFFGRQGFTVPYFVVVVTNDTAFSRPGIQIGNVDDYRLSDVYQLDLHVEKTVRIAKRIFATLSLDCFNVANSHTVLQRYLLVGQYDAERATPFRSDKNFNAPTEVLGNRAFRGGVRISF